MAATATAVYSLENARKFAWSSVSGHLHPERVAHLERFLTGKKVLDAGCGGGAYVAHLVERGFEVTGVDRHIEFLNVARDRGFAGSFVEADLTRLPFPDKTFDTVYCFDVLEHVDDVQALRELVRVARQRVLVTVPRENERRLSDFALAFSTYLDMTHLRYYNEESLRKLAQTVSPSRIEIHPEIALEFRALAANLIDFDLGGPAVSWFLRKLYRALLKISRSQVFHAGLLAVIDLSHSED